MIESKIEKGEEAEEFKENKRRRKVEVSIYLKEEYIEWVEKHYGSLSNFIEKIYQDYVRAINELK